MPASPPDPSPKPPAGALTAPQKALRKLGLVRDIDLALHLPLRYEDETRIVRLRDAREGDVVQIEATVKACEVTMRPRRQLMVTVDDGSDTCVLRFFSFYPSQQKALAVGARIRARGEVRGGFMGLAMMHPSFHAAGGELPTALTPVYPTGAGLPQSYLRRAVAGGVARADLSETLPADSSGKNSQFPAWNLRESLHFLHHPSPDVSIAQIEDRSHPAWQRLKAEELLAQQLSQLTAKRERAQLRAPLLVPVVSPARFADHFPVDTMSVDGLRQAPPERASTQPEPGPPPSGGSMPLHEQLLAALPFALTGAQHRVSDEISRDLARPVPMHRLLQGDVGSGKTVVAALAAAIAMDAGWQCALMAPTEILAEQHFRKLIGWLEPLGIQVAWLTGSQKKKERREMLGLIESGKAALVVGTHAVIQEQVKFRRLALAIIDEQHRFGVAQRLALRGKMGLDVAAVQSAADIFDGGGSDAGGFAMAMEPHLLMMSATPIPRTLAMSYYADLDVSTIDELPPGRTPIITKVVSDSRRDEVIERIRGQLAQERQVYWVCPLIEESEALDLSNATATHAELSAALNGPHAPPLRGSLDVPAPEAQALRAVPVCTGTPGAAALSPEGTDPALGRPGDGVAPGVLVGLLHSRMTPSEKKVVMGLFSDGLIGVLVSTTVIEVGVDVPNASLMVIEHAERFGLSQLHQLRGRVGRGAAASACVLLYSQPEGGRLSEASRERLKAMAETNDGFEIARRDLEIRGPGEFLGARQSGAALLRFADLATDTALLEWARDLAPRMLDQHADLARRHIARWLGGKSEFLKA